DYFGARYYSSGLGRWLVPDWSAKPATVPYAILGDPQSLNLYTYVRNIPTTGMDPDGHCDNTFCQAAAEQLHMQAGVFIGSARFLWHNIPVSHAISGIHQAYRDVKNPAEAQDRQKAQLHMAATVAKAAFGGRTWAGITARMEVADAVVNAWK